MSSFSWPGGARLAVSLVVNVEEGAEENILDGDRGPEPVDEFQDAGCGGFNAVLIVCFIAVIADRLAQCDLKLVNWLGSTIAIEDVFLCTLFNIHHQ